jgi:hypothetical protein
MMSAAQVWNVAGLVLSLIGILVLISVWRAVSHPKQGRKLPSVSLRRIYGVLGWIGLGFVAAGTITQIVGNLFSQ